MTRALTVKQAVRQAGAAFAASHSLSPRLDAELLLAEALGVRRERLYAEPERELTGEQSERFAGFVERRERREPVAYILGRKAFRTIELQLNENTLIPRPETETLVEVALEALKLVDKQVPRALDIGTGSGNIALALATEDPTVRVVGTDIHPAALEMAHQNAGRLGLQDRVEFLASDLYDDLPGGARFDVIVSNPPYVTADALRGLQTEVRGFEPHVALLGGNQGLEFYERIIPGAPPFLEPHGTLAVEIAEDKVADVRSLFVTAGRFEDIDVRNDLGGLPRVVFAREKS